MPTVRVITSNTSEKYLSYADVILPWFIEIMQKYVVEITPIMSRCHELCDINQDGQFSDEIGKLTEFSRSKKREILSGHINEQIYISAFDTAPTRFDYFNTECTVQFVMKTSKKAAVIAHSIDSYGSDIWHKFEFRPQNDRWILDKMFLSYESENGPYKRFDF